MRRFFVFFIFLFLSTSCFARQQIRIVGSSTMYPFITIVAEHFGKIYNSTPVVEATGTGGGFHIFCSGNSINYPDIVNASRPMKPSEIALCNKNEVHNIKEILIGYDGIIIAQSIKAKNLNLSMKELFLAIAKKIPYNGKMIDNSYKTWNEINPNLPKHKIEIYGPSSTSGTRDAFIELVMQNFCESSREVQNIITNQKERKAACSSIREDGPYIEMPEKYNLIINKLISNNNALAILSMSLLVDDPEIRPIRIDNIAPNKTSIINRQYSLARPLFLYFNMDHAKELPLIDNFINYLVSPEVLGKDGYLSNKGLITK